MIIDTLGWTKEEVEFLDKHRKLPPRIKAAVDASLAHDRMPKPREVDDTWHCDDDESSQRIG